MNVQSIPERTGQEAKFDNQVRLPAKSESESRKPQAIRGDWPRPILDAFLG